VTELDPVTHVDVLHDGQAVCQIQVTDGRVNSELKPGPQRTRYESHEWTGNDPDYCARCGVDWDDADVTCEAAS
jgi:hypothetical protein